MKIVADESVSFGVVFYHIACDHQFTNNPRFPSEKTTCIIFILKGNLTSQEEIDLINRFLNSYSFSNFKGRLVTQPKEHVKVR